MILYGIPNCNTVKKARDWLDQSGFVYQFYDFKKQGISAAIVENWLSQHPHEQLINRSGLTWRGLSEAEKSAVIDNPTAIQLMLTKTSVIKRPILEKNGKIIHIGFDQIAYKEQIK